MHQKSQIIFTKQASQEPTFQDPEFDERAFSPSKLCTTKIALIPIKVYQKNLVAAPKSVINKHGTLSSQPSGLSNTEAIQDFGQSTDLQLSDCGSTIAQQDTDSNMGDTENPLSCSQSRDQSTKCTTEFQSTGETELKSFSMKIQDSNDSSSKGVYEIPQSSSKGYSFPATLYQNDGELVESEYGFYKTENQEFEGQFEQSATSSENYSQNSEICSEFFSESTKNQNNVQDFKTWSEWTWSDLRKSMLDLMLMLYNDEHLSETPTLLEHLTKVLEILNFWRLSQNEENSTAQQILNLMVELSVWVVGEIRYKLLYKACCRFQIISFSRPKSIQVDHSFETGAEDPAEAPIKEPIVFEYPEKSTQFDNFAQSMWSYLDLLNRTSPLLEDLYFLILDAMNLEPQNQFTIFQSIHWQGYRNLILKDASIRSLTDQIEQWRESGHAVGNPGKWIDKVRLIRSNMDYASSTYEEFWRNYERSEILQTACQLVLSPIKQNQHEVLKNLGMIEEQLSEELTGQSENEEESSDY